VRWAPARNGGDRLRLAGAGAIGLAVFVVLWEVLVRAFDVRPFILRAPSKIVPEIVDQPRFFLEHTLVTGRNALAGLLIALGAALVIGAVLATSRFLELATQPVLTLIQVTPWVAYISSVVLWLGRGTPSILFMVAFVSFPAFAFATVAGLRSADPAARELLASVEAARWEVLWRLRLPSALPWLFTAARFNVGLGLAAAYFTEGGSLSAAGLGWVGDRALAFNNGDLLWAAILCTAVLGVAGLALVTVLERALLGWHVSQRRPPGR
jgi:ABC-type nitrate/sulfonate/bicarbonate transport system permease component